MIVDSDGAVVINAKQAIKVKVDSQQQIEIAIEVIKKQFNLCNSRNYYHYLGIDNKLMLRETVNAGSHEHETSTAVRDATAEDRAALLVMGILEKRMHGGN